MDVSRHPDIITPPTFPAPSPLSRRHDQTAVTDSHVPQPSHSGSAKDYIDRIRRNQAPDASTAPPLPVPSRPVPPPRPAQPPRATKTETPEAWYHFTIGDGIEMRVREDRYREAGGRLRAIVDAASNAARRYGLSPPDHPGQSKPD